MNIKDRKTGRGGTVPLGQGCAKFKEVFEALRHINYEGPFIIQGARDADIDDFVLNQRYFEFCKRLLSETYGNGEE